MVRYGVDDIRLFFQGDLRFLEQFSVKIPFSWLKELVDVPVEAARLGDDLTMAGLAIEGIETHGGETVLDLDITTNRVDCMNVLGVAREVSVIYGVPLRAPDVSFTEKGAPASAALTVAIEAADLCPRFCARVADVAMGPAPAWMRERLEQVGVRPISNVVDLTNYVMIELGQPSHAFDLARIPGGALVVRLARDGRAAHDTRRPGPHARRRHRRRGVRDRTAGARRHHGRRVERGRRRDHRRRVRGRLLEPACASAAARKALGMHTEASHRFERQCRP